MENGVYPVVTEPIYDGSYSSAHVTIGKQREEKSPALSMCIGKLLGHIDDRPDTETASAVVLVYVQQHYSPLSVLGKRDESSKPLKESIHQDPFFPLL